RAAGARFVDLLQSPSSEVALSTITLEDEALVTRSLLLDEVPHAKLITASHQRNDAGPGGDLPVPGNAEWLEVRGDRARAEAPLFHGFIGARAPKAWSVSALETYLACPFKFFAQHVLKLEEEPDDEEVMDPRRQGRFVHEVFERFFHEWQASGRRAMTPADLDAARELFTEVVDRALERLPAAEGGLERTRLLGSPAAAGLGDAVFRMEAERPAAVVERLLEARLDGSFVFTTAGGERA